MKKKKMLLILIFTCVLNFVFLPSLGQAKTFSGTDYLNFGQYVSMGANVKEDADIEWSFSGSNSYVGIIVMAMDQYNFNKFDNGDLSAFVYILSDGDYISHHGTFRARSDDKWFIVFLNLDLVFESTSLTYEAKFPSGNVGLIVGIVIGAIVILAIIGAGVEYLNKKKRKATLSTIYQPYTPYQPTEQQPYAVTEQKVRPKVCPKCRYSMEGSFCTNCGSKMES